jgi:hypothetical protein
MGQLMIDKTGGTNVEPGLIEQLVEELFIYHALQTDRERQVLREMVIAEFTDQLRTGVVAHIADKTGPIN